MRLQPSYNQSFTDPYSFQGMEHDDEVKGDGNSYTTEFRQYDPRLGRWLTLDLLMGLFPSESPYNAFVNNPTFFSDPTGLAPVNEGGPEKKIIPVEGEANANSNSENLSKLPKTAENGQVIRFEYGQANSDGIKAHEYTYSSDEGKWSWSRVSQDGSSSSTGQYIWPASDLPDNSIANKGNNPLSKTSSNKVEKKVEDQNKKKSGTVVSSKLSKTLTVGGILTVVGETSADDMAKPPKYASKSVPNRQAWAPVAKQFKTAAKWIGRVGKALGITSIVVNAAEAANKWSKGDKLGAAWSATKAAVDGVFLLLKANPITMVLSIGWSVLTSFW